MFAESDAPPPTAPSLRGAKIRERVPNVEVGDAPSARTAPLSTSVPLIRVARWMQLVAKGEIVMGPGASATHTGLLLAVAQYQGQNAWSTAGQRTLAGFANTVERTARTALAELVRHGWLTRNDEPHGRYGYETRYAVAATPGNPIPARGNAAKVAPAVRQPMPADPTDPPAITADVARQALPHGSGNFSLPPQAITADKETSEEIKEKITEKTIAHASARGALAGAMSLDLFGEATKPPSRPAKKPKTVPAHKRYGDAWIAAFAACGVAVPPMPQSAAGQLGQLAATYGRDASGNAPKGADVDAWIRKIGEDFCRQNLGTEVWALRKWLTTRAQQTALGTARASPHGRGAVAPDRRQPGAWAKPDDAGWRDFDAKGDDR